jgi:spore maturation protein CgeB
MPLHYIKLLPADFNEECEKISSCKVEEAIFRIKTSRGWKTLDSIHNPMTQPRQILGDKISFEDSVVLLGLGSGFLVETLLERKFQKALLITGSEILAQCNLRRVSKRAEVENEILIIAALEPDEVWQKYLLSFLKHNPSCKIFTHHGEVSAFPRLFSHLEMEIENFYRPLTQRNRNTVRKILLPVSGGILEDEIVNEFEKRGLEIKKIHSLSNKRLSFKAAWDMIKAFEPDLTFSINNQNSDMGGLLPLACSIAGIKWGTWFLDDPRFLLSPEEISVSVNQRIGFCWDLNGVESCKKLGFKEVVPLPLATNPEHFSPGAGDDSLAGKVVFVGNPCFSRSKDFFAALNKDRKTRVLAETFEEEIISSRRTPGETKIEEAINSLKLEGHFTTETRRRLTSFVVQQANLKYRVRILTALADLGLTVIGTGWEKLLPASVEISPPVDYYRDLVKIYRSDAIHLSITNLQMRAYPNQRIFDIGACGRLVLNDELEGWNDLFGNSVNDLIYRNLNELREKVIFYQELRNLRKEWGEFLRFQILAKHTFSHRIDKIMEIISKR